MNLMKFAVVAAAMFVPAAGVQAASVVASYELNNTFADQLGGTSLTGNGGTFTGSALTDGLSFGANQGPTLTNGAIANSTSYSLELIFTLADVPGYNKIIDFSGRTQDNGLYIHNGALNFFGGAAGSGIISNGQTAQVVLTNNAGTVTGFLNGVQQFSFTDVNNLARIGASLHFFQDDSAVGGEASPGFADLIRLYDAPLTAAEVAGLYRPGNFTRITPSTGAVPEPATWAMMLLGFGFVGATMRSAKRNRKLGLSHA